MQHDQVLENLSSYLEDGLDPAMSAAMENHLRSCADCHREMVTLRGVFSALEEPGLVVEPPAQFHNDVMRRIRLSQQPARRTGVFARWNWGWGAAAFATAAVAAALLFPALSPYQTGTTAGPKIDQILPPRPAPTGLRGPEMVIQTAGPAVTGQEYHLTVDFLARSAGIWKMSVTSSPGMTMVNDDGPGMAERMVSLNRDEHLGLSLVFRPTRSDSVQEIAVRFRNQQDGAEAATVVFVPVQTGGSTDTLVDWTVKPGGTLRTVLHDLTRAYGVTMTAPEAMLDQPVGLALREANATTAVQGLAGALNLRGRQNGAAYNLIR